MDRISETDSGESANDDPNTHTVEGVAVQVQALCDLAEGEMRRTSGRVRCAPLCWNVVMTVDELG